MKLRNSLCLALAASLLSGCLSSADRTRYYFLATPPPASSAAVESGRVFIAGFRITTAEYLRTRKMLVQLDDNQLRPSAENVWQETLAAGFARVLAARFAQNLPDCQLTPLPASETNQPEMVVEIDLHSLLGRLHAGGEAEVSAELRILDATGRILERDELRQIAPWTPTHSPGKYPALAAAESRAAADLADAIGVKVLACHRKISGQ